MPVKSAGMRWKNGQLIQRAEDSGYVRLLGTRNHIRCQQNLLGQTFPSSFSRISNFLL
jgi:hypothetical protein